LVVFIYFLVSLRRAIISLLTNLSISLYCVGEESWLLGLQMKSKAASKICFCVTFDSSIDSLVSRSSLSNSIKLFKCIFAIPVASSLTCLFYSNLCSIHVYPLQSAIWSAAKQRICSPVLPWFCRFDKLS